MSQNAPATQQASATPVRSSPNLRVVAQAGIALGTLAFSVYLFSIGQGTVGSALAGMVVAHYFQSANGQATADQVSQAVATVGALVKSPAQNS